MQYSMPQNSRKFSPSKVSTVRYNYVYDQKATRLKKWNVFDTIVDNLCSQLVGIHIISEIVVTLLLRFEKIARHCCIDHGESLKNRGASAQTSKCQKGKKQMVQASIKTKIGVWLCRWWERVVGSLLVGIQPHPF